MYQLINDEEGCFVHPAPYRQCFDSPVDDNRDYHYLDWVAEGNTPEVAE